jgi:hypothetical protein
MSNTETNQKQIEITDVRERLLLTKEKVFGIYNKLDLRTKLLIGIGYELESMSAVNVKIFDELLQQFWHHSDELIEQT